MNRPVRLAIAPVPTPKFGGSSDSPLGGSEQFGMRASALSQVYRAPRGAFSLVELIVVIAIIAVLAMVGFFLARNAMDLAKTSKCTANLRQLSTAALSYASDNGGKLPWYWNGSAAATDRAWFSVLAPYLKATVSAAGSEPRVGDGSGPEKCLICPAKPDLGAGGIMRTNIGYGWNFIGLSQNDAAVRDAWTNGHSVALVAIEQPAKTVMITCTGNNSLRYVTASSNPSGGSGAIYRPEGVHKGKANAVFCDGHVELMQLNNSGPANNPTVRGLLDNYWWRVRKP